jgi:hypothetical protein
LFNFEQAAVARPLASNGEASSDSPGSALKIVACPEARTLTEHRDTLNYLEQRTTNCRAEKRRLYAFTAVWAGKSA